MCPEGVVRAGVRVQGHFQLHLRVCVCASQGVVMAAVRVFYMRVMNDEMLRPFFEDIDLARLKNKLVSQA